MSKILVRGMEIGYDLAGTGTPVVLLHGFPFNRTMWSEQIEALAPRHRVLAPDLRGLGETTATTAAATMEDMARDVCALMEKMNISRAAVCGLSMGGYVALALYRMFPLRARALVLADTRPGADSEEARANREVQAEKALQEGMAGIANAIRSFETTRVHHAPWRRGCGVAARGAGAAGYAGQNATGRVDGERGPNGNIVFGILAGGWWLPDCNPTIKVGAPHGLASQSLWRHS